MSANGWRWVYYFNAIFFGVSALLIGFLYRPPPTKLRRETSIMAELKSLDLIGTALLLCGVIGVVLSLTWGGNVYAWSNPRVVATLVIGLILLVGFCLYGKSLPLSDIIK